MKRNVSVHKTEMDRMLDANMKLVDELSTIKRDMMIVVSYYNGNTELKKQFEEIMKYYEEIKIKG